MLEQAFQGFENGPDFHKAVLCALVDSNRDLAALSKWRRRSPTKPRGGNDMNE
jgi:hypothetical protein